MQRVAVLGGGVSGLAAALHLTDLAHEHRTDCNVMLFEARAHAGGCVQTRHEDGFTMELGPDSLLVDKPAAIALLRRLRLEDQLTPRLAPVMGARIVHRGRLRPIPDEFRLFTPTSLPALLRSGIFSAAGIARAALEPFVPARRSDDDESVASFVTRRFGREVLDRLAQPLIGGIYSGDPARLSMQATLPQFLEMERSHGSLLRAMRVARQSPRGKGPELMSLRGGLGTIIDALTRELGQVVHTSSEATSLRREDDSWTITFADGSQAHADAIVCALPAYTAATLLRSVDGGLAALLERIGYNSIATVNLAYDAPQSPLVRSSGFVVPYVEGRRIVAATISSQKYPERAPHGRVLLRAFVGGALQPALLELDDAHVIRIASDECADLLHLRAQPRLAVVQRWPRVLPEYAVGHTSLVQAIETSARRLPGFAFAGSAYHGVGIPDCVSGAERAAKQAFTTCDPVSSG